MRWAYAIPMLAGLACLGQEPAVQEAVSPAYPAPAVAERISGSVIVEVHVAERGAVASATVVEGNALLRQASLDAARLWRFNPPTTGHDVKLIFPSA